MKSIVIECFLGLFFLGENYITFYFENIMINTKNHKKENFGMVKIFQTFICWVVRDVIQYVWR